MESVVRIQQSIEYPPVSPHVPPVAIRHQRFAQGESARQLLAFECAPSFSSVMQGKGMALVELADGRVFFFRTSLAVMRGGTEAGPLFEELHKLPAWIADWNTSADFVGYMIGAPLEFIDKDPSSIENWNISEWKQHATSWLATKQLMASIQQIQTIIAQESRQLSRELAGKLAEFMGALVDKQWYFLQGTQPYSWQSGHSVRNYLTPSNEQLRRYRRQADATFPLVIQQMIARPRDESTASILQAIDNGVPLVEHLANLFQCPKKCVRHLGGLRFEDIGIQWTGRLKELLMFLGSLDVNRLPKNAQEWEVFGETITLLSALTKMPTTSLSGRLLLNELSKQNWRCKFDSNRGPVIVYNQGFEKTRIVELANSFPDLACALRRINDRVVDLLPITRRSYYHPAMMGSWSIKAVLPTVAPDLEYAGMIVGGGDDAQAAYREIAHPETQEIRKQELIDGLREYCRLDTLAMARLVWFLEGNTRFHEYGTGTDYMIYGRRIKVPDELIIRRNIRAMVLVAGDSIGEADMRKVERVAQSTTRHSQAEIELAHRRLFFELDDGEQTAYPVGCRSKNLECVWEFTLVKRADLIKPQGVRDAG